MKVLDALRRWWDGRRGTRPSARRSSASAPSEPGRPAPGRDELTLEDRPTAAPRRHGRSAGIDPYSNDAGYAKPQAWERIDHD